MGFISSSFPFLIVVGFFLLLFQVFVCFIFLCEVCFFTSNVFGPLLHVREMLEFLIFSLFFKSNQSTHDLLTVLCLMSLK